MRTGLRLLIIPLLFLACLAQAQTLQINNVVQPTCTDPNSGIIEVELVGSSEPEVIFRIAGDNPPFVQTDQTTSKVMTYTGLSESNYFIDVFFVSGGTIAPGVFVALDITDPVITVPAIPVTVCSNDGPQDLLSLVSADIPGGTFSFSGSGVSGNFYDPVGQSGFENVTVNYTLGVCNVNNTITFDIEPAPIIIPQPTTVCEDNGLVDLLTLVTANIPGGSFVFSGAGVSGQNFDPTGLSGLIPISTTYTLNNCTVNGILDITVQELPVLDLPATAVCDNQGLIDLTTVVSANPGGGTFTFSGTGISGNDFDPTGLSGPINIDVTYDQGVCSESGVLVLDVQQSPVVTLNPTTPLCDNSGPQDLLAMVSANPGGGSFSFSGAGVSGTTFDGAGLGGSAVNIDVTYVLNSCTVNETLIIDVESAPILTLAPLTPLCENSGIQDLTTMVSVNPAGGTLTFSGPGVAGNNFDPSGLGGSTVNIDVTYILGSCLVTDQLTLDVEQTPVLTLNPVTPLCENESPQDLLGMVSANPGGGTFSFSGSGVNGNNFDPQGLSGPINIDITYDLGSCTVSEVMVIEVEPTPQITLNPTTPVCDADSPYDLLTMVSANPGGGTFSFSGPGVSGNQFDPMGQSGMVNIAVTYQLSACTVNEILIIEVEQAPTLSLTPTTPLCVNAGPQDLASWVSANPGGGTFSFSGPGVTGTTFDPAGLNGFVSINVDYTLGACAISATMQVDVQAIPNITFNAPSEICNDSGLLNLLTMVTVNPMGGTLTFNGPGVIGTDLNPAGLVGPIDIQVTYSLNSCVRVETLTLNFNDAATVDAGPDQLVCATDPVMLNGTIGGGATSGLWTTTGTGTFNDDTNPSAIYTPSNDDITGGSVILTLITNDPDATGPCSVQSSSLTITFNPAAVVDAGPDQTICEGDDVSINGSVAGAASNPTWITLGGGSFDDPAALSTTYIPDATDIAAGTVQLILSTDDPDGPGGCPAVTDTIEVTINQLPVVDAGADQAIQAGSVVNLNGIIGASATSSIWSSNGSGVFDDVTSLTATYTPSAADIISGSVILILTTNDPDGPGPCIAQSDLMTVLIVTGNTVSAGPDQDLCEGSVVNLTGLAACISNGTTWTTNGTGSFDDPKSLTTVYNPSAQDVAADSILIILSIDDPATSLGCIPQVDTMVLKIHPNPLADAGTDVTICQGESVQLSGSGATNFQWSPVAGLDDPTIANPLATPMTTTTYTLVIQDDLGCSDTAQVTVEVIVTIPPSAPASVDICQNFVSPRLMAQGTDLKWYSDAGLTNQVATGPEYQPGPAELDLTVVGSTTFYVTQDVGCGESVASPVTVNVFDSADPICSTLCPTVDFDATPVDVVCFGDNEGEIQLSNIVGAGGSSPVLDVFLDGSLVGQTDQANFTIDNLVAGDYSVTVQQTGVCTNSFTAQVSLGQPAAPIQANVIDPVVSLPDQATGSFTVEIITASGTPPFEVLLNLVIPSFPPQSFFADFAPASLNSSTGNHEISYNGLFAGTYEIIVRDANGCSIIFNFTLEFDDGIFIPNIFTPNNDDINETFFIRNLPANGSVLVISNRWGKVIFESNNYQNDWDGDDNSDGTYFYRLEADGRVYKGWIELWRGKNP